MLEKRNCARGHTGRSFMRSCNDRYCLHTYIAYDVNCIVYPLHIYESRIPWFSSAIRVPCPNYKPATVPPSTYPPSPTKPAVVWPKPPTTSATPGKSGATV